MAESAKPFGRVSSHLLDTIRRQLNQNGIVIWYDPKGDYRGFVESLPAEELPGIPLEQYDGSFIALRHRIEPLLSGEERPKLLIYIPLERAELQSRRAAADRDG